MKKIIYLITGFLFFSFLSQAQSDLILNNDWNSSQSYESFDEVSISNKGITFTVDDNHTVEVSSISVDNNLTININPNAELIINSSFDVKNNITINLQGKLTINGDVIIKNNAELDIESTGTLDVDGDFDIQSGVVANDGNVTISGQYSGPDPSGTGTMTDTDETIQGTPLPVELLGANIESEGAEVTITWTTATEKNNDYFTLFFSTDMEQWEELARVSGNGTKNTLTSYEHVFNSESNGAIYIKLIQTDFDGTTETLRILSTEVNAKNYRIYPQPLPSGASWKIRGLGADDTFKVYSSSMQQIRDYQNLTKGFYYVVINNKKVKKLIVQ